MLKTHEQRENNEEYENFQNNNLTEKFTKTHKTREKSCEKVRKRPVDVGKWEIKNLAIE